MLSSRCSTTTQYGVHAVARPAFAAARDRRRLELVSVERSTIVTPGIAPLPWQTVDGPPRAYPRLVTS